MFENIRKYSKNLTSFYFNVLLIWGGWGGLLATENTEFFSHEVTKENWTQINTVDYGNGCLLTGRRRDIFDEELIEIGTVHCPECNSKNVQSLDL
jgi:hypothetical protein